METPIKEPTQSSPNYKNLLFLITGLLIIVTSLFLIYFLIQNKNEVDNAPTQSSTKTEDNVTITQKDDYYFENANKDTNYGYLWENTYSYPELFSNFNLRADQLDNEFATQLDIDSESFKETFNGSFVCVPRPMETDQKLMFGSVEAKQKYTEMKEDLLSQLKVEDDPAKMNLFIKSMCKDNSRFYFAFSISGYMNSVNQNQSLVRQAYAGGGDLNPDTYLAIIYKSQDKSPFLMSITPYNNFSEADPSISPYEINQPKIEVVTFNNDETYMPADSLQEGIKSTQNAAYFSYSDMSIYPSGGDYLYLRGKAGDGCCGIDTILAVNLASLEGKELFTCINGFGSTLCKNHKGKLYYQYIKP